MSDYITGKTRWLQGDDDSDTFWSELKAYPADCVIRLHLREGVTDQRSVRGHDRRERRGVRARAGRAGLHLEQRRRVDAQLPPRSGTSFWPSDAISYVQSGWAVPSMPNA